MSNHKEEKWASLINLGNFRCMFTLLLLTFFLVSNLQYHSNVSWLDSWNFSRESSVENKVENWASQKSRIKKITSLSLDWFLDRMNWAKESQFRSIQRMHAKHNESVNRRQFVIAAQTSNAVIHGTLLVKLWHSAILFTVSLFYLWWWLKRQSKMLSFIHCTCTCWCMLNFCLQRLRNNAVILSTSWKLQFKSWPLR